MKCMPSTRSGRFVAAAERGDRNRRRVRGEDDFGFGDRVEAGEQRALGVDVLDDRLDDVVGLDQPIERGVGGQARQRRVAIVGGQLAFLTKRIEALFDALPRAIEQRVGDIDEPHRESVPGQTSARCRCPSCPPRRRRSWISMSVHDVTKTREHAEVILYVFAVSVTFVRRDASSSNSPGDR